MHPAPSIIAFTVLSGLGFGLIFWLGAVAPDRYAASQADGMPLPSLHSALFAPDYDPAIATGVDAMTSAVVELFKD